MIVEIDAVDEEMDANFDPGDLKALVAFQRSHSEMFGDAEGWELPDEQLLKVSVMRKQDYWADGVMPQAMSLFAFNDALSGPYGKEFEERVHENREQQHEQHGEFLWEEPVPELVPDVIPAEQQPDL